MIRQIQRDPAVALAERLDADPHDLAGRHDGVEVAGIVAVEPRRQDLGFEIDAGSGAPCSCSITSSSASVPCRRVMMPCHVVTSRPSTA